MVNDTVLSRYQGRPTRDNGGLIQREPLYPADQVLRILDSEDNGGVVPWTRKCVQDLQDLALDVRDVSELIRAALRHGRFINAQWCQQKPDGPWAACDSYSVVRQEWVEAAGREMDFDYYLKFAINRAGKVLLVVSCHPPRG